MDGTQRLIGLFHEAANTAQAIDALHEMGVQDRQITVMTGVPYPERALGRHSEWLRLPFIVLAGALGGMTFGFFMAVITPHLYRLDVGGHPTVGFPPAAVIIFVFTMMATIVSTFLGVLWEMNFPEFGMKYYDKMVTDGHIGVIVEYPAALADAVRKVMEQNGGHHIHRPERQQL